VNLCVIFAVRNRRLVSHHRFQQGGNEALAIHELLPLRQGASAASSSVLPRHGIYAGREVEGERRLGTLIVLGPGLLDAFEVLTGPVADGFEYGMQSPT
jgi:hypothetical protein